MKEFDPRINGSIFYAPEKDSGGMPNPSPEAEKAQDAPIVHPDKQERIVLSPSLQEEIKLLGLNERLDRVIQEYPDKYDSDTVLRIRRIIYHDLEEYNKRRPPNLFQTINDFQLYYLLHPEWQSMSTSDMHDNKQSGAGRFYETFNRWVKAASKGDNKMRRELFEQLYSRRVRDRKSVKTIGDWIIEFQVHPDWQGKSPAEMDNDKESGASAFYAAFLKWARKVTSGDEKKRSVLVKQLFILQKVHRRPNSIEEWVVEFQSHPEWNGKRPKEMSVDQDKESGASAFYSAFMQWVEKKAQGDKKIRRKLIDQIFPPKHFKAAHLTSINDWKDELNRYPQWKGKSMIELETSSDSQARAFIGGFRIWARKEAKGDPKLRRELTERIFDPLRLSRINLTTIEDWLAEFQTHPDWQGRTPTEMHNDEESGASAFHSSFNIWLRETGKTGEERIALVKIIFPNARRNVGKIKSEKESVSPQEAKEEFDKLFENP